jgi:hypothetical protein
VRRAGDLIVWALVIIAVVIAFVGGATFQEWLIADCPDVAPEPPAHAAGSANTPGWRPGDPIVLEDLEAALVVARAKSPLKGMTPVVIRVDLDPAVVVAPIRSAELVQGRVVVRAVPLFGGG